MQQALRTEVAAGREQPVRLVERELRIGNASGEECRVIRKGCRIFNSLACLRGRRVSPILVQPPPVQGIGPEPPAGMRQEKRRCRRAGSGEAAVSLPFQRNRRRPPKASDRSRPPVRGGAPAVAAPPIYGSPAGAR